MVETIDVHALKPHPKRKHFAPELAVSIYDQLKADIAERGIQDPLQICCDLIICGHNRHRAAIELGLPSVPVIRLDGLSDSAMIVHAVKDNILRRQMDDDQRAIQLAEPTVKKAYMAVARARQAAGGAKGGKAAPGAGRGKGKKAGYKVQAKSPEASKPSPQSRDEIAMAANTSTHKVRCADVLWKEAPEKAEQILAGGKTSDGESLGRVAGEIKRKEKASEVQKKLENGVHEFEELFKLQRYDVWNIQKREPGFGIEWPGNIPASLVANVLYYFTKPGDLVIDPMAGGGVTGDVCKALERKCKMADINPSRAGIIKHDIGNGPLPEMEGRADLVFLDPPYWTLKDTEYADGSASELDWDKWLEWMRLMVVSATAMLKSGGYMAALMQDNLTKNVEIGEWSKPSILCLHDAIRGRGLKFRIEISVPLSTQQVSSRDMEWGKLNRRLLGIRRSMLIYQK